MTLISETEGLAQLNYAWGSEGASSLLELCVKAEQGLPGWEYWEEKEDDVLRFHQTRFVGLTAHRVLKSRKQWPGRCIEMSRKQ